MAAGIVGGAHGRDPAFPGQCGLHRRIDGRRRGDRRRHRLPEVLAEHARSIKVQHTQRPFAVAMAGENEFDPFRD
jgi:hypothetical protein